jgi:hypothetical protein
MSGEKNSFPLTVRPVLARLVEILARSAGGRISTGIDGLS